MCTPQISVFGPILFRNATTKTQRDGWAVEIIQIVKDRLPKILSSKSPDQIRACHMAVVGEVLMRMDACLPNTHISFLHIFQSQYGLAYCESLPEYQVTFAYIRKTNQVVLVERINKELKATHVLSNQLKARL
jgi:hypothetical protein